ncbi:hypothetical protein CEE37_03420 [candidate division LCP-89 bacterium B3_LCP]|uniref:FecR protein domain-containing protein n=1 Tax=candidate division LCP-89 bacterium B3_LCP TaxID=2012998 RepID=A0A532V397_UNCL8|nr:MAG: hypothetical protein CEE37_03420 [candidate division LCP-89 bacterium B3_LCP]
MYKVLNKYTLIGFAVILLLSGLLAVSSLSADEVPKTSEDPEDILRDINYMMELTKNSGEVTYLEGRAKRLPKQSERWIKAEEGSEIEGGDKVRTLRESRAELALKELNIIRMAPLTTIDIIKLYEETKESLDETQINVEKGDIWALVEEVEEDAKFNISTPVTGAAITGTKFRISVREDSSTVLKVYEGEVRITNKSEQLDQTPQELPEMQPRQIQGPKQIEGPRQVTFEVWYYIVKNMQEIHIGKDGQLLASGSFSADDPDEKNSWVQWNLQRDKERKR